MATCPCIAPPIARITTGCAIAKLLAHSGSPNVPGLLDTGLQRERDLVSVLCVRRLPNPYSGVEQHAEVQTPMNLGAFLPLCERRLHMAFGFATRPPIDIHQVP